MSKMKLRIASSFKQPLILKAISNLSLFKTKKNRFFSCFQMISIELQSNALKIIDKQRCLMRSEIGERVTILEN